MHPAHFVPDLCSRIRAALDAQGRSRGLTAEVGGLLRVLAASKSAGHVLCFGDDAGEAGAWVLDGMDMMSGLVVLVQQQDDEARLRPEFDRDVRASVHRQEVEPFLVDVNAHRFNLIVDRVAGEHPEILRLALGMLRPGGLCVVVDAGETVAHALAGGAMDGQGGAGARAAAPAAPPSEVISLRSPFQPEEFSVAPLGGLSGSGGEGNVQLIVRRPAKPQRKRRRR